MGGVMVENFEGYLYHIVRYKKLKQNQKLHFGSLDNQFFKTMNEWSFVVGDSDLNSIVLNKKLTDFTSEEQRVLKGYVYESCMIIRELVLEIVKLNEFADYPSRLKCMYCVKTKEQAENWIPILKRMNSKNPPLQIVKLKAKGKIFRGDGNLMIRNTRSLESKFELARKYWNNATKSDNEEILFIGNAEVEEIYELT